MNGIVSSMKIDIERLIDAELEEMDAYEAYTTSCKRKIDWGKVTTDELRKWREEKDFRYHDQVRTQWQMIAIMEVLDCKHWKELYSAARAVRKWREKTNYERFLNEETQVKLKEFIFGKVA